MAPAAVAVEAAELAPAAAASVVWAEEAPAETAYFDLEAAQAEVAAEAISHPDLEAVEAHFGERQQPVAAAGETELVTAAAAVALRSTLEEAAAAAAAAEAVAEPLLTSGASGELDLFAVAAQPGAAAAEGD